MEVVVVWIVECSRSRKCFTFGLYASLMADRSLRFIQGCARRVCLFGWRLHFFRQSFGMFMSTCILGLLNLSYMLIMQERHGIGATHDSRKDAGRRFSVAHLNSLLPCIRRPLTTCNSSWPMPSPGLTAAMNVASCANTSHLDRSQSCRCGDSIF